MKKIVNSFYMSRVTFIISALLACIGWIVWGVLSITSANATLGSFALVFVVLLVLLLLAYKKGQTNLQKMLMGGVFIALFYEYNELFAGYFVAGNLAAYIYASLMCILIGIVFIAHLFQQSDHAGESVGTTVGQSCGFINIILLVWDIYLGVNGGFAILDLIWTISLVATIVLIISMETRIKEYKKIRNEKRSKGCWTEEERQKAKLLFKI